MLQNRARTSKLVKLTPKIPANRSKLAFMIDLTVEIPVILKSAAESRME